MSTIRVTLKNLSQMVPSSGPIASTILVTIKIVTEVASVTSATRRSLDAVKGQIAALTTEASIATFLSAVQAAIVTLSIANKTTHLEIATNAFGFMGIMWDVIAAFLGLYTSTTFQRNVSIIEKEIAHLTDPSVSQDHLMKFMHRLSRAWNVHSHTLSPLCVGLIRKEILPLIGSPENPRKGDSSSEKHVDERFQSEDRPDFVLFVRACHRIDRSGLLGQAVGAAMLFGVICFLGSALCLAISTQPKEVYIPCAVACSCIVAIPFINMFLPQSGIDSVQWEENPLDAIQSSEFQHSIV